MPSIAPNFDDLRRYQKTLPQASASFFVQQPDGPWRMHAFLSRTPLGLWCVHTEPEAGTGGQLLATSMRFAELEQAKDWMGWEVRSAHPGARLEPALRAARGEGEMRWILDSRAPKHMKEVSAYVEGLDCEGAYKRALRCLVMDTPQADELFQLLRRDLPQVEEPRARALAAVLGEVAAGLQDGLADLARPASPFSQMRRLAPQLSPAVARALTEHLAELCARMPGGPHRYPLSVFLRNLLPIPLQSLIRERLQAYTAWPAMHSAGGH